MFACDRLNESQSVDMHACLVQERDLGDEYGWKQVPGDVFRPASHRLLFTSLIGTGYHLSSVAACVIFFTIMGDLYTS